MSSTVDLLSTNSITRSPNSPFVLTPFHCICIVDPTSTWFEKWTLSSFGKAQFISSLTKNSDSKNFISQAASFYIQFLLLIAGLSESNTNSSGKNDDIFVVDVLEEETEPSAEGELIVIKDIDYLTFINCIRILGKIASCNIGKRCWPIPIENHTLNQISKGSDIFGDTKRSGQLAIDIFARAVVKNLLENGRKIELQFVAACAPSNSLLVAVAEILIELAKDPSNAQFVEILFSELNCNLDLLSDNLLAPHLSKLLREILVHHANEVRTLSGKYSILHHVVNLITSTSSNENEKNPYSDLLHYLDNSATFSKDFNLEEQVARTLNKDLISQAVEFGRSSLFVHAMVFLASTSKGILLLENKNLLTFCAEFLMKFTEREGQNFLNYRHALSKLISSKAGTIAQCENGHFQQTLRKYSDMIGLKSDFDSNEHADRNFQIEYHEVQKDALIYFCSFNSVAALIEYESQSLVKEHALNLSDFVNKFILSDVEFSDEFNNCGLHILKLICTSLDSFILFQTKYKFTSKLVDKQRVCFSDSTSINDHVLLRNNIIVSTYAVGGPSERVIPPKNLAIEVSQNFLQRFPIVSKFPIPKVYYFISEFELDETYI
ncbi:hypothetical protein HK098_003452 [Nowakowskiella sp. JEL0407]|nr:hypothetical protein HK098_003452 [Nowakowskiella sp. JEL0407]